MTPNAAQLLAPWRDNELLDTALRHCSAGRPHNERLEFIGDAVLSLIVAHELFDMFPDASEGELTRMRANLVCGNTLAVIARESELNRMVILGTGEEKSGGRNKTSILSGTLEAVIGAIYCLGGLPPAREFILRIYAKRFDALSAGQTQRDAKTRLQEYLQARGESPPEYQTECLNNKNTEPPLFKARCITKDHSSEGIGKTKRMAEQEAAGKWLSRPDNLDNPNNKP